MTAAKGVGRKIVAAQDLGWPCVAFCYNGYVSEISDKAPNYTRCGLVCGHREGRCGKIYLRSRLGGTYGGEVRAWLAVGIWERLVRRNCEGILRSGNQREARTRQQQQKKSTEMK
jgi:hypothetical protein